MIDDDADFFFPTSASHYKYLSFYHLLTQIFHFKLTILFISLLASRKKKNKKKTLFK